MALPNGNLLLVSVGLSIDISLLVSVVLPIGNLVRVSDVILPTGNRLFVSEVLPIGNLRLVSVALPISNRLLRIAVVLPTGNPPLASVIFFGSASVFPTDDCMAWSCSCSSGENPENETSCVSVLISSLGSLFLSANGNVVCSLLLPKMDLPRMPTDFSSESRFILASGESSLSESDFVSDDGCRMSNIFRVSGTSKALVPWVVTLVSASSDVSSEAWFREGEADSVFEFSKSEFDVTRGHAFSSEIGFGFVSDESIKPDFTSCTLSEVSLSSAVAASTAHWVSAGCLVFRSTASGLSSAGSYGAVTAIALGSFLLTGGIAFVVLKDWRQSNSRKVIVRSPLVTSVTTTLSPVSASFKADRSTSDNGNVAQMLLGIIGKRREVFVSFTFISISKSLSSSVWISDDGTVSLWTILLFPSVSDKLAVVDSMSVTSSSSSSMSATSSFSSMICPDDVDMERCLFKTAAGIDIDLFNCNLWPRSPLFSWRWNGLFWSWENTLPVSSSSSSSSSLTLPPSTSFSPPGVQSSVSAFFFSTSAIFIDSSLSSKRSTSS